MKKWGLVVTFLYAVIVLVLLAPALLLLASSSTPTRTDFVELYRDWGVWLVGIVFIAGQLGLLLLSVDTTQKRMRSRTPIVVTAIATGLFLTFVTGVVVLCFLIIPMGEGRVADLSGRVRLLSLFGIPWVVWSVLFYLMYRDSPDPVTRCVSWLFRGSVLELLVAVPSHVIVRRRHDCCAPTVTAFGITSGIAIMLISFGPSVLLLFKKRMEK